jgi:hypothetical protein
VCEFCRSVVARGDRDPEDLGKVAYLVTTDSPLSIGLRGRFQGEPFELTGRAQFSHEAGGVWNEWYAAFPNDRWGWLAEAQGRYYLTFQRSLSPEAVEPFSALVLGALVFALPTPQPLSVTEKGIAHTVSAEGEIPYRFLPGVEHPYADLSGPNGEFATLDYSDDLPQVFIGQEVNLAALGFPLDVPTPTTRVVEAQQLACPNCGGALTLQVPDRTERVTCPSCGSLLAINQGTLKFLRVLVQKVAPIIPLGTVGNLAGQPPLTVIGFLQRSVEFDDIRYFWEEYLLYAPTLGFRWLVRSDDHWNFVRLIPPGKVAHPSDNVALYEKRKFKLYQETPARVEQVLGEFYWRVEVGETVMTADYISPPWMLSREVSTSEEETTGEINWSLGNYLLAPDVAKAFGLPGLPKPWKIAPNQPFPHRKIYEHWLLFAFLALVLGFVLLFQGSRQPVMRQTYQLDPVKVGEESLIRFSEPFALKSRENVEITLSAPLNNSWVDIAGDLINQQTDDAQGFSLTLEYYSGVEDGESWSEGSRSSSVYLSAPEAGTYLLGLDVRWDRQESQPATFILTVRQGIARPWHLIVTLLSLSVIPLIVAIRHFNFERKRWSDSVYNAYDSGD